MSEHPLKDVIVTAFRNLGGRAHLSAVYKEVRRLGYDRGGKEPDKIVRSEIQKHSRNSRRFSGKSDDDLFRHVGPARSGIWELREVRLPEEVPIGLAYSEGSVQKILVNRYERDPRARDECIQHYGTSCFLCAFDFVAVYGEVMAGFTHVHHLRALSSVGADYEVDPIRDLRPVCPNCHAVLHRREPPYSLDEVREFLRAERREGRINCSATEGRTPMTDIEKARQLFREAGLAFPTIPEGLAVRLKEQGRWLFSTREIDMSPYNLEHYVHEVDGTDVEDYAVLSHSGHGANSYAIQYYLVYGALRMLLHLGWGGVYMGADAATDNIRECFSLADQIVPAALAAGRLGADGRLTVVGSDFYGSYWSAPGQSRQKERSDSKAPAEVLAEVLHWLERDMRIGTW